MRCNEARTLMEQLASKLLPSDSDNKLIEHLESCAKCRHERELLSHFDHAMKAGRDSENQTVPSMEQMRHRVQTQINQQPAKNIRLRPALVSVALSIVLLMFVSLVPFDNSQTIGYHLRLDGVNQTLAEDNELFCDLLSQLGLWEAEVDCLGCDLTCKVVVRDLKSEQEISLVMAAVQRIDAHDIKADIIPITDGSRETLLGRANRSINSVWN